MCMNVHTCTYQLLGSLASLGIAVIGKIKNCSLDTKQELIVIDPYIFLFISNHRRARYMMTVFPHFKTSFRQIKS